MLYIQRGAQMENIFAIFGSTMMNSWAKQLESAMFMQAKAKIH